MLDSESLAAAAASIPQAFPWKPGWPAAAPGLRNRRTEPPRIGRRAYASSALPARRSAITVSTPR